MIRVRLKMKKDFLSIAELNKKEIEGIFELSAKIKKKLKKRAPYRPLKGKTMAMIFHKPSARTRVSFETGMYLLGGYALYLGPADIGLGNRESISDVARVLSRYNHIIMARLFAHEDILGLAKYASIPVINGLTDLLHPCQIMADAFTIIEHRKTLKKIKIAYIGDGNNVANSWLNFASRFPISLNLAVPQGYEPNDDIYQNAVKSGKSTIEIYREPKEAAKNADVIYTDVWTSMGQEAEYEKRNKAFKKFQVNDELLKVAKSDVLVMHCLPAHRGHEISDSVIDGPHSIVFDEAENRMHVQNAIIIKLLS